MGNSTINTVQIKRGRYPEGGFTRELKPYELGWTTNEVTEEDNSGKTLYIRDGGQIESIIKNNTYKFQEVENNPEIRIYCSQGIKEYLGKIEHAYIPIGGNNFKQITKDEVSIEIVPQLERAIEASIEASIEYTNERTEKIYIENDGWTEIYNKLGLDPITNPNLFDTLMKTITLAAHPVGEVYTTTNASFNPNTEWGGTWEKLSADAYLKIVTSGAGSTSGSLTSGGPSTNTSDASSGSTGGPSTNTSGSTAITEAQMPSHNHNYNNDRWQLITTNGLSDAGHFGWENYFHESYGGGCITYQTPSEASRGGDKGHTHTLSSHTHSLNSHTHDLGNHTHDINPTYYGTYAWHRIA